MNAVPAQPPVPVSVVVSTLDRPQRLSRCLDALLSGSRLPEEVVVVDQGDPAPVRALMQARRGRGVRLVHVVQRRRGLSTSQNAGVAAARCPVVAVVDDDCVPDHRWVEVAHREHASSPGPVLVTGRVCALPAEGDRVLALSLRESTTPVTLTPDALPWDVGTGGNFCVTRAFYQAVGGNDERLGTGAPGRAGNDLDLFRRLLRAGVTARYEPDLVVQHERATKAEHVGRRWTYGFGVGTCVWLWHTQADAGAAAVLRAWLRLRLGILVRARRPQTVLNELRVLAGTAAGIRAGRRLVRSPRVAPGPPPSIAG